MSAVEGQQGEAREPVLAHVVTREMGHPGVEMVRRRREHPGPAWVLRGEGLGQGPEAPGPAEIQPVEMGDLAVAAVCGEGGREQRGWPALGEAGQEAVEPGQELIRRQQAAQGLRLDQAGR